MKEIKKYTIGDMAKLCGVSPRQLRYYDQRGLIKPSFKNPKTGYRYYTEDQIEAVFYINELKNTGVSNESIQRLCEKRNVDQLVQELQAYLARIILEDDDIDDAEHVGSYGGWNAVTTISIGGRSSLRKAYQTLFCWSRDHNIKLSDMAIEEYMVDTFSSTNESEFATRILIPILE